MSQVQTLSFFLRLLSNCIISQSSATAGDHDCLDYIPGSALLGVVANRLYADLPQEQSKVLFHSGAVRFGDALPVVGDDYGWPVPLCWHQIKGEDCYEVGSNRKRLNPAAIFDPSRKQAEEGKQPKQLRDGHITVTGQLIKAEKDYELKTAINAETGSAASSQLFGYQSLKAGQSFVFTITLNAGVDSALVKRLEESLTGQVLLGRSRSAQFGEAFIEKITQQPSLAKVSSDKTLRLWLLSDLALLDDNGNPLLSPTAKALGLPEGSQWQVNQSFIRTRSYTPFNGKRQSYDLERQVISRGSVLVFSLPRPLTEEETQSLSFVGQYQAMGLGKLAVNPALLADASPVFDKAKETTTLEAKAVAEPNSLLVRVLNNKKTALNQNSKVEKQAKDLVVQIQTALNSAAAWLGLPKGSYPSEAPARTQWGEVRNLAVTYSKQPDQLDYLLFSDKDEDNSKDNKLNNKHALMRQRAGQAAWKLKVNAKETLAGRIQTALTAIPAELRGQALAYACTQLMSDPSLTQSQQGGRA